MIAFLPAVSAVAVATAVVLTWTGLVKLVAPGEAALTGLRAALGRPVLTRGVVRAAGAVELAVVAALLAAPAPIAGIAAAVLGLAFLGYLARLHRIAPGASCGCAGAGAPVTSRSFARAGLVAASGVLVAVAGTPWWRAALDRPGVVGLALTVALAAYVATSPEADGWWLLPLRRVRVRLLGHPMSQDRRGQLALSQDRRGQLALSQDRRRQPALSQDPDAVGDGPVPVAASVDLLESSLAWQSAAHVVQSSLQEHWVADDCAAAGGSGYWRVLRYAGRQESRPVSVLFAVDAWASTCSPRGTAVRVTVVDDETGRALDDALRTPRIRPLPVA